MADDTARQVSAEPAASGLKRTDFFAAMRANRRRTTVLCLGLILLGGVLGYVIGLAFEVFTAQDPDFALQAGLRLQSMGGLAAGGFMIVFGTLWTLVALFLGDKIVLGLAGAREVTTDAEPRLHNVVEEMAIAAGLPKPRVYVIETPALNAFATGLKPEKAAIGVTRGLLDTLSRDELQGVIGHEMGHIANDDIVYMTAVGVIVGMVVLISDVGLRSMRFMSFGGRSRSSSSNKGGNGAAIVMLVILLVFLILAPIAAKMLQMAISREREYLADATGVKFTRNPLGLIGALKKIDGSDARFQGAPKAIQHLFITNPFKKFGESAGALFSTHPAISQRIERLQNLG
ncbi:MAG: M48 family metallopeptidase [Alphaproteobacteria bacterium]